MKKILMLLSTGCFLNTAISQAILDLSLTKGNTQTIDLKTKSIRLINCSKKYRYQLDWDVKITKTPVFEIGGPASDTVPYSSEYALIMQKLNNSTSEDSIKKYVAIGNKIIEGSSGDACIVKLKASIAETEQVIEIPYLPLKYNQIITIAISKFDKDGNADDTKWTFILKTEEKTRWLVHYGLTYAPSIISKTNKYFAFADTGVANRYTVTKNNDNGPKPWDNISATINFTYPFHNDSRLFDGGFTAGFGISTGFELSGHAGLSAVIGENVILSSGLVFMQRYKLRGEYKEGQVIKTNLNFEALHEKVWFPEVFFTIGFRFGSNPFAKKSTSTSGSKDGAAGTDD
jgi:hypothetical protein